jgi:predicted CoA-binding protein
MANVAILGASEKPERYAHQAQQILVAAGHRVFPVARTTNPILGVTPVARLEDIADPLDTVTVYIGPAHLEGVMAGLLAKAPRRVIFNPGTESDAHEARLAAAGIECQRACTLVLLSTGQF